MKKSTIKINWSIQSVSKFTVTKPKNWKKGQGVGCSSELAYVTMRREGKKKVRKIHKTLGEALHEVGI